MSAKYKSPRKAIPIRIETAVLAKSRRRCTLCFGLNGDVTQKRGQIVHLDRNRNNNAESNLAWMCLDHHSLFDSTTKQHKNYTIPEVKEYRRRLYKALQATPQRASRRVRRSSASKPKKPERSTKVINSPVASGTKFSQTINSPTLNLSLPAPTSGTRGRERYDEWRELIDEIDQSVQRMGYAFLPLVPVRPGDDRNDYQAGIRRGNRVLDSRILIADAVQKAGLKKDWDELVQYAHSARGPVDRWQQGSPTMGGFDKKAREFQEKLMRIAREDMDVYTFALPDGQQGRPLVIPLRYGAAPTSTGKHMMGYYGLVVANHGEPAYDVSVLTSEIPIGTSKLQLEGIRPTLTKADGDAFFRAGILESPGHGIMGSGLFDEMRRHHVAEITVELTYKDAENRWYKTVGKIERNVSEPGGLSVRYIRREQTGPSNAPAAVTVEHTVSRMIDSGSDEERFEEHRRVIAERPKLFLEYLELSGMTFSGLRLKNDGGRAFNIEFEPEVLAGLTLKMDNPTRSIEKADEYDINLRACEKKDGILHPIGGMLSGQVRTLFERLSDAGADDEFKIQIKCNDFDRRVFTSQSILRWDLLTKRIWCERGD